MNTIGCVSLILCLYICVWWSDSVDFCSGKCDTSQICVRHPRERRMVCILKRCMRLRSHGFCRKFTFRYYFDPLTFECNRFAYGGCYGSRNNFLSKESCESRCTPPPVETNVFTAITFTTSTTVTTSSTTTTTTPTTTAVTATIATNTTITTTPTTTSTPTATTVPTAPTTTTATVITIINTADSTPTTTTITPTNTNTTPTATTTAILTTTTTLTTTTIPTTTTTIPTTTTPMSCGNPPSIPGLQLLNLTNGTLPGDVRYYICQNESLTFDYISTANSECSSITCQNDGHWTNFNGTCNEPFAMLPTNVNGSIAGSSGIITSPNWPAVYAPPNHAVYRYSIITAGNSITFTFNGVFGIDSQSALAIFCGFDVPIAHQDMIYINKSTTPEAFTCLSGCATVAFQVGELGTGNRQGFNMTWQANN